MDCRLPSYSVYGILHAKILEWVSILFSRGSSQPWDQAQVSCIIGGCLPSVPPGKYWPLFYGSLWACLREGDGTPLQYSCLENPMDGGGWWAAVHGVAKSRTRLSNFTLTFHFHKLEKKMATHSSVLAWRIPGMGEPGGLLSMGLHRVGHGWSDLAAN